MYNIKDDHRTVENMYLIIMFINIFFCLVINSASVFLIHIIFDLLDYVVLNIL